MLLSMTWVVTIACVLGLTKREGVFLCTPKARGKNTFGRSLRIVEKELFLAISCVAVISALYIYEEMTITSWLLMGLLGWQALIYGSTLVATVWSWRSEMLVANPAIRFTARSTGERFRHMITDRRAVYSLVGASAAVVMLFFLGVNNAPELELIYRTNPHNDALLQHSLIQNPPESYIAAIIYLEEQAALQGDVELAIALWGENCSIRDLNYTPQDESDDKVWIGIHQVRDRYQQEFRDRQYIRLEHYNISSFTREKEATLVNDLKATIRSGEKLEHISLSKGDRWVLRKVGDEWKIASLNLNRTLR